MDVLAIFDDAFGRVDEGVHRVMDALDPDGLAYRPDPAANSVAWLVWHLTRVRDDHLADLASREQFWFADGWEARFALPFEPAGIGYGHSSEQVEAFGAVGPQRLREYHQAVADRTHEDLVATIDAGLDRVVDRRWDPPVTAGVRLVSVLDDATQHVGQAAYVRGLYERSGR